MPCKCVPSRVDYIREGTFRPVPLSMFLCRETSVGIWTVEISDFSQSIIKNASHTDMEVPVSRMDV